MGKVLGEAWSLLLSEEAREKTVCVRSLVIFILAFCMKDG